MHPACRACGLSFAREPGFYLGSIYLNYGATVILTGAVYALMVLGLGFSTETALGTCLAAAVLVPLVFFRHARSFLLSLDCSVNQHQARDEQPTSIDPAGDPPAALGTRKLAALASDDGRAGCAMGVALALILLFGLGMAVVTLMFAGAAAPLSGPGDGLD
ncbi:MAG: hypothetical protein RLZZ111_1486 [Planctomycetota bacterium]|jgi:hypothetical protein